MNSRIAHSLRGQLAQRLDIRMEQRLQLVFEPPQRWQADVLQLDAILEAVLLERLVDIQQALGDPVLLQVRLEHT